MKTLRKSLNAHKEHHISSPVSPLPALSKPITTIQPPKKVIKALGSHRAAAPQELSFDKGDFFHVINDVGPGQWYEAHNPATGARGLVPCEMFEEFSKGGTSRSPQPVPSVPKYTPTAPPKFQAYFAVVLHDFIAERTDELDAKSGDTISVVAQSNREWFVAKPIGRLGRAGLIPVSFVEVRDPVTGAPIKDISSLIDSGSLPRVEDWKKSVMAYKASSISLGVLDESTTPKATRTSPPKQATNTSPPSANSERPLVPDDHNSQQHASLELAELAKRLPKGILLSAEVQSFHYEMEDYWFRIRAIYQPYSTNSSIQLPPAKELVLFRSYNDFYDFQIELLDGFPHEAGRPDKHTRILPFMPGPADTVDNEITVTRRQELDEYLKQLADLRLTARYILEHHLVREFLSLKPGDAEQEVEPRKADIQALFQFSHPGSDTARAMEDDIRSQLARTTLSDRHDTHSNAKGYDDSRRQEHQRGGHKQQGSIFSPVTPDSYVHPTHKYPRPESVSSVGRSGHPQHAQALSRSNSRTGSPMPSSARFSSDMDAQANNDTRSSLTPSQELPLPSMRSSQAASVITTTTSASGRSRSQSSATLNIPLISATNPQTAFLKIKIFDSVSDDLVAIRVHPQVTHSQLMDKVQARLGGNVLRLSYRDSAGSMTGLENDGELKEWLDGTERLVLFAD